jgi:Flp pilus assembly protein TadB
VTSGLSAGGATVLAALAAATAVVVLTAPDHGPRRLASLGVREVGRLPSTSPPQAAGDAQVSGRVLAAVAAAAGVFVVLDGMAGLVLALPVGLVAYRLLLRLEPRAVVAERERVARDLPVAAHLLASALAAGAAPVAAIELVAAAIGGPVAPQLRRIAALSRLGGDLASSWRSAGSGGLAPLARTVSRALETGAPLADALDRLAADLRSEQRFDVDRRARSVGVRAAAPLGLCFLPAFLLIGVVPVVIGIATTILTTVG